MNYLLLKSWGVLAFSIALTFTATSQSALSEKSPTVSLTSHQHIKLWSHVPEHVKQQGKNQSNDQQELKNKLKDQAKDQAKDRVSVNPAISQATVAQLLSKVTKPLKQPRVYRTTIEGNYAIASWLWGEAGGQTILIKKQGRWQVLRSGGGAVDVGTLKTAGVPEKTARTLMQKDAAAQNKSIDKNLRSSE